MKYKKLIEEIKTIVEKASQNITDALDPEETDMEESLELFYEVDSDLEEILKKIKEVEND